MARTWSELRERFPSTSELLEFPPLRALSERLNHNAVVAGVRSFLHELQADIERRRAEDRFPTLAELAARAAQHIARLQQPSQRPGINATGRLFDSMWIGQPLADSALQQMITFGNSYVANLSGNNSCGGAARIASSLTGAEAATVVHSYSGAIWLALSTFATGREVLVARADVGEVEPGCSLAALANSAGAKLHEVGCVNRTNATDFEAATSERARVLLKHRADGYRVPGGDVDLESLVSAARDGEMVLIDAMGRAPLIDGLPGLPAGLPSAMTSIATGASLVIVRTDGLVGGPPGGLLLGSREAIDRIELHPMFAAYRATSTTLAALHATLELFTDAQQLSFSVPIYQLLTPSVENLRNRAERLAPQFVQAEDVVAAEAVECEAELGFEIPSCVENGFTNFAARRSYCIALTPKNGDVIALSTRLQNAITPVVGRPSGKRLLLDLRTVFPRDDQRLVQILVGQERQLAEELAAEELSLPIGNA